MNVALGKLDYKHDPRTLMLGEHLAPPVELRVPNIFDFDKRRAKLPIETWGNNEWGNCVMVGQAHHVARHYRIEARRSLKITAQDVIAAYQAESERQFGARPQSPGDPNDRGLYVLEALKGWRGLGWNLATGKRARDIFEIAAYGELNQQDRQQLRAACFLLHGIHFGIWLPRTAAQQWQSNQSWDDTGSADPDAQPGSWGGHLVYAKRYDEGGFYCITWGREQYMTNRFIERYVDESWATVDALDKHSRWLNVQAMIQHLHNVGATIG